MFSALRSAFGTPPLYLSALTVATITAQEGLRPAILHLMSKNFSAPKSAPKLRLGNCVVTELESELSSHNGVAAVGYIGEGPPCMSTCEPSRV